MGKILMTNNINGSVSDVFSYFIKSCDVYFEFLIREYNFSKAAPGISPPECWIEYRKGTVTLYVIYEYGDFPWIRVTVKGKDNSLDNIMKKNWNEQPIKRKKGPLEPNARVDFALTSYSDTLRRHVVELIE